MIYNVCFFHFFFFLSRRRHQKGTKFDVTNFHNISKNLVVTQEFGLLVIFKIVKVIFSFFLLFCLFVLKIYSFYISDWVHHHSFCHNNFVTQCFCVTVSQFFVTKYVCSYYYQTHTPCGFLLVGTAFSNCLGLPIIFLTWPGLGGPGITWKIVNVKTIFFIQQCYLDTVVTEWCILFLILKLEI